MTKLLIAIMAIAGVVFDMTSLGLLALVLLFGDYVDYRKKSDAAEFLRKSKK